MEGETVHAVSAASTVREHGVITAPVTSWWVRLHAPMRKGETESLALIPVSRFEDYIGSAIVHLPKGSHPFRRLEGTYKLHKHLFFFPQG